MAESDPYFSEKGVTHAFPTCIWDFMIADHERHDALLLGVIDRLREEAGWSAGRAATDDPEHPGPRDHPFQTPENLHTFEELRPFTEVLLAATTQALAYMQYVYESVYITSCWANISLSGQSQHDHSHANNLLSGIYYLKTPEGAGPTEFIDPRTETKVIQPAVRERTPYNSDGFILTPEPGLLVLFPSWLRHLVRMNNATEERITVAFNAMVKGDIGSDLARARL